MTFDRRTVPVDRQAAFIVAARACAVRMIAEATSLRASVVVLETCERFEVYADSTLAGTMRDGVGAAARELVRDVDVPSRWLSGRAAVRHLYCVASGIDSRIVGEPHILGQVRRALAGAIAQGTCAGELRRVVEGAVQCGRLVRRDVQFSAGRAGYAEQAAEVIASRTAARGRHRVCVIGTGALARAAAVALRRHPSLDRVIVGRHEDRVRALAAAVGAAAASLDALAAGEIAADAVLSAIDPLRPVVSLDVLRRAGASLAVDLGALPAIESSENVAGIELLRLSAFGSPHASDDAIARAETHIDRELNRFSRSCMRARRHLLPRLALVAT